MTDPAKPTARASTNGAGDLGDLASAFMEEVTHPPAGAAPDPDVATSFALGWQLGNLATDKDAPKADDEYGLGAQNHVYSNKVRAYAEQLTRRLSKTLPSEGDVDGVVREAQDGDYQAVLAVLCGADATLGKALELGRRMHAMTTLADVPLGEPAVQGALSRHLTKVDKLLLELASALPPNSAHAVHNALRLWRVAVTTEQAMQKAEIGREAFREQGRLWRDMLSGDLAAKDVLRVMDYVGTARDVVQRVRDIWKAARRTLARWTVPVLALLVLGVTLMILAAAGALNGSNPMIAGATTVLAAVGLTWKAIGEFFGRQAAKSEQALWDAELDWTIAYRSTTNCWMLAAGDLSNSIKNEHRREYDHVVTWIKWKDEWPDVEAAWHDFAGLIPNAGSESSRDAAGPGESLSREPA